MFPKIFIKALLSIFVLIVIYVVFVLAVFVPNIERHTMALEERIGETQLQKTVQIVNSAALEMASYQASALASHKQTLEKLTTAAWHIIAQKEEASRGQGADAVRQKQREAINTLRRMLYNDNDYFFISDYRSVLISHPYLQDIDFSEITDLYGNLIVPPMVQIAQREGKGFTSYWWKKNNDDPKAYEKLSFVKNFEPWQWVVGTGVYIDNIEEEIASRKEALIKRLQGVLRTTKIGESGYVYIFNSKGDMIIHPDASLEGKNIKGLKNPGTDSYILDDLINAYKYGNKRLYYLWDAPDDRGNFIYEKVSWIEYDPYFDWYICSSGYLNEFRFHSEALKEYILYAAVFITLFITLIGLYLLKRIFINPLVRLADNAKEVIDGDRSARYTGSVNDDEIGILATQFNLMLDTINEQIATLDAKVQEKTKELSHSLKEKDMLLKEIHHRVKNNLFVISGILGLQAFQEKKVTADEVIETMQNRIHSIAMAHEMLCRSDGNEIVNIQKYIKELVETLLSAYSDRGSYCSVTYDIEPLELTLDQVLSCGLIVNELVTNAIKYAFSGQDDRLQISLHSQKEGFAELCIRDNGSGFDSSKSEGIGLELVRMSVKQLEGTLLIGVDEGTRVVVTFPR